MLKWRIWFLHFPWLNREVETGVWENIGFYFLFIFKLPSCFLSSFHIWRLTVKIFAMNQEWSFVLIPGNVLTLPRNSTDLNTDKYWHMHRDNNATDCCLKQCNHDGMPIKPTCTKIHLLAVSKDMSWEHRARKSSLSLKEMDTSYKQCAAAVFKTKKGTDKTSEKSKRSSTALKRGRRVQRRRLGKRGEGM